MPGHAKDVMVYQKDLAKAKSFLSKAKYTPKDLEKMELDYVYLLGLEEERLWGMILLNSLEPLGLKVKLRAEPWPRMVAMATKPETSPHFLAVYVGAKYPSADIHTYGMFHSNSWGSYMSCSWYENPKVNDLLQKARTTVNMEKGFELYGEAQKLIAEDAAAIFMINPPHRVGYWNYVKGYTHIGLLDFDRKFYTIRIEK